MPTVLVVDDVPLMRDTLCRVLQREGFEALAFEDGSEVMGMVGAVPPDLILLDVNMPGADGPSVCRQLKTDAATGSIKILMLTAASQAADRQRGLEAGADGYITKPFSPRALLDQIGAHLGTG